MLRRAAGEPAGQALHRRRGEDHLQRQRRPEGPVDPVDQGDGQQRVAAAGEEVVLRGDALLLHHLLPQHRHPALGLVPGSHEGPVGGPRDDPVGDRQRLEVDLAVGGGRQRVEHHDLVRDHVVRQVVDQVVADQLGRPAHVDRVLPHALVPPLLAADPAAEEEVRGAARAPQLAQDAVEPPGRGQVVAAAGAVAGGHEAEVEVVQRQPLRRPAQVDVAPPPLRAAADHGDPERRPAVDGLVDRDDLLAQHEVRRDQAQPAVLVEVLPRREVHALAGVDLDEQVHVPVLARSAPGRPVEAAEVVVLLGDAQPGLDLRGEGGGPDVQAVGGQDLLQEADDVAGLDLQDLGDVRLVDRLDGAAAAEEVHPDPGGRGGGRVVGGLARSGYHAAGAVGAAGAAGAAETRTRRWSIGWW